MTARGSSILGASVVSAVGTGISRVLGAARDIAISHVFGDRREAGAFFVAWTVPSVFRRFVADEGLTGALIPAVAQAEKTEGEAEARRLAGAALTALLIAGAVLVGGGILGAPWLAAMFGYGFTADPGKYALTVQLTRWLFPFVAFVSLVSYCEGLLNHRGHFFVPKVAPGIVSGSIIVAVLLLSGRLEQPALSLAIGVVAGGLVHLLVCVPPLVLRWGWPVPSVAGFGTPRFRFFLREMGKVAAIGIVAQLNVVLLRNLATLLAPGSVPQYWYANRIVDLAQGVIAVAVGSALLPAIARDVAEQSWDQFRRHFTEAMELAAIFLLPAAGLLIGLAEPLVAILYRHGQFDVAAAARSTATLQMLVPFMLCLGGINIVKKVYFALDDRVTPLVVGTVGLCITAGLGYLLSTRIGVEGLGLALSISGAAQLAAYVGILGARLGTRAGLTALVSPLTRLSLAVCPAALAAFLVARGGDWSLGPASLKNWLLVAAACAAAGAIYLALGWILRVESLRSLLRRIARR
jgi:putative peptidoglycan lipid II flippase